MPSIFTSNSCFWPCWLAIKSYGCPFSPKAQKLLGYLRNGTGLLPPPFLPNPMCHCQRSHCQGRTGHCWPWNCHGVVAKGSEPSLKGSTRRDKEIYCIQISGCASVILKLQKKPELSSRKNGFALSSNDIPLDHCSMGAWKQVETSKIEGLKFCTSVLLTLILSNETITISSLVETHPSPAVATWAPGFYHSHD